MKGILAVLLAAALTSGLAAAAPSARRATLTFTIAAGVRDYDIFVGPLGGGICIGSVRITDPKPDADVAWSPDGRRLVFDRQTGTLTSDVFVADANGSHLRNLSRGSAGYSWDPDWSRDGTRVVYVASNDTVEQLVTIRPDGTGAQPVPGTAVDPNDQLRSPQWTPDGAWIAYTLTDGIHLIHEDGSGGHLLLGDALGPDWSPDGTRIAFTRAGDLALADADGSNVRFVTRTPNALEGAPAFSPDGTQLFYTSIDNAPRGEQGPGNHMYMTDADGGNRREIFGVFLGWVAAWRPPAPAVKGRRCVIRGTPRSDRLAGTSKGDLIYAGGGNDVVRGRGGDDIIVGDVPFSAHPGKDRLYGGPGRDYIDSYDGRRDVVDGGSGKDRGMFDGHDRVRSIERQG